MRARGWSLTGITGAVVVAVGVHVGVAQAASPVPAATVSVSTPTTTTAVTTTTVPVLATRCGVRTAAQAAVDVATAAGESSAVAVLDTETGTLTTAGQATAEFDSASVVKVLLATQLLLSGQMTGDTADTALEMITQSDDDAANAIYALAGGDDVVTLVAEHYGITDLGSPPASAGQWGETQVTATGLAQLYAALADDPVVWPWLSAAMAGATATAADGTDQTFGIPLVAASWAVKQGWMVGLGPGATYASTGYVDDDRYVVVLLSSGASSLYGQQMAATMTAMATALMPDGVAPGTAC